MDLYKKIKLRIMKYNPWFEAERLFLPTLLLNYKVYKYNVKYHLCDK